MIQHPETGHFHQILVAIKLPIILQEKKVIPFCSISFVLFSKMRKTFEFIFHSFPLKKATQGRKVRLLPTTKSSAKCNLNIYKIKWAPYPNIGCNIFQSRLGKKSVVLYS